MSSALLGFSSSLLSVPLSLLWPVGRAGDTIRRASLPRNRCVWRCVDLRQDRIDSQVWHSVCPLVPNRFYCVSCPKVGDRRGGQDCGLQSQRSTREFVTDSSTLIRRSHRHRQTPDLNAMFG